MSKSRPARPNRAPKHKNLIKHSDKLWERRGEKKSFFLVFCPACDAGHLFEVPVGAGQSIDYQAPTFMGLKLTGRGALGGVTVRCHLKVVNGRIKFLNDCPHAMRGKVVEMAVIPKDYGF